jgi:hypothetical protein
VLIPDLPAVIGALKSWRAQGSPAAQGASVAA